jgi:hypothetical protein
LRDEYIPHTAAVGNVTQIEIYFERTYMAQLKSVRFMFVGLDEEQSLPKKDKTHEANYLFAFLGAARIKGGDDPSRTREANCVEVCGGIVGYVL